MSSFPCLLNIPWHYGCSWWWHVFCLTVNAIHISTHVWRHCVYGMHSVVKATIHSQYWIKRLVWPLLEAKKDAPHWPSYFILLQEPFDRSPLHSSTSGHIVPTLQWIAIFRVILLFRKWPHSIQSTMGWWLQKVPLASIDKKYSGAINSIFISVPSWWGKLEAAVVFSNWHVVVDAPPIWSTIERSLIRFAQNVDRSREQMMSLVKAQTKHGTSTYLWFGMD